MPAVVWDGIEAWWGAQAISTMIGTWSIRWAEWDHPLADGTMQLKDFIGCMNPLSSDTNHRFKTGTNLTHSHSLPLRLPGSHVAPP